MGQTITTLTTSAVTKVGDLVGYRHEEHTTPEGGKESMFVLLENVNLFNKKFSLAFTVVDAVCVKVNESDNKQREEEGLGEMEEEVARTDLVQESVDVDDDGSEGEGRGGAPHIHTNTHTQQEEALPPLAFVDDEEEQDAEEMDKAATTATAAALVQAAGGRGDQEKKKKKKMGFLRRAHSNGAGAVADEEEANNNNNNNNKSPTKPRSQSVGASFEGITASQAQARNRIAVQSVSEVVTFIGADGEKKVMNRVRLILMSQEEGVLGETNILIPVVEGEKKKEVEVHDAHEEKQQENRNNPSCQSVRVSLEACVVPDAGVLVEEKESTATATATAARAHQQQQQQHGGERDAAEELNLEIQQVERRRPIAHMTKDAAAVVPTVTNNKELEAAVLRLCSAYAKDETSPTVISNKHDIRLICSYLSEVILPPDQTQVQIQETKADHRRARTISPPLSPYRGTHEPIIEKGGGTGPTTTKRHNTHTLTYIHAAKATIASITASSALPPSTQAGDEKSDNATFEISNSTSTKTAPSSTIPPEKPKRRRKIRLSASTFEELGVTEMDASAGGCSVGGGVNGVGDFDADGFDFWGAVENTPVSKGKGKKKKALIRPDDDSETEGVGGVEGW